MPKKPLFGLSALFIAFLCPAGTIFAQSFEDKIAETAENLPAAEKKAFEILEDFPPSKYFYVSIGRSATPMMAIIENILERRGRVPNVAFIPMSNARYYRQDMELSRRPEDEDPLLHHFTRFLPAAEVLGGRSVLVVDLVADSGESLKTGAYYTERALRRMNLPNTVTAFGFRTSFHWNFDYFAPYDFFDVQQWRSFANPPVPGQTRLEYALYRRHLKDLYNAQPNYNTRICTLQLKGVL